MRYPGYRLAPLSLGAATGSDDPFSRGLGDRDGDEYFNSLRSFAASLGMSLLRFHTTASITAPTITNTTANAHLANYTYHY